MSPADSVEFYTQRVRDSQGGLVAGAEPVTLVFNRTDCSERNIRLVGELLLRQTLILTQLPNGRLVDFGDEAFCGNVNQLLMVVVQHNLCHK